MEEKTETDKLKVKWGEAVQITTVDWLWKPFIPFGKVTIVQGDGGEGKTTMMLAVAAMLSQGIKPPVFFCLRNTVNRSIFFTHQQKRK